MNNDRKKDQDEAGNTSSQKTPVGEPNRPGQTQGEPSKGKKFEGGREGSSGERGVGQSKDKKTTNVDADDDSNSDDKE